MFGSLKLQYLTSVDEVCLVDKTVLELSERWRFLGRLILGIRLRGVASLRTYLGLRFDGLCLGGLNALQVYLLHSL